MIEAFSSGVNCSEKEVYSGQRLDEEQDPLTAVLILLLAGLETVVKAR
jgi:hypothetical protein